MCALFQELASHVQLRTMNAATDPLEVQIGRLLKQRGLKLAVAESCTGGLVADRLTDVPGSSDYFRGGIVAYAYEAKVTLLGVSWATLRAFGAVSRETVMEMARGVRTALGTDVAVSVSGIAGPGGGMPNKPVGTTWFGLSTAAEDRAFYKNSRVIADGTRCRRQRPPCKSSWIFSRVILLEDGRPDFCRCRMASREAAVPGRRGAHLPVGGIL